MGYIKQNVYIYDLQENRAEAIHNCFKDLSMLFEYGYKYSIEKGKIIVESLSSVYKYSVTIYDSHKFLIAYLDINNNIVLRPCYEKTYEEVLSEFGIHEDQIINTQNKNLNELQKKITYYEEALQRMVELYYDKRTDVENNCNLILNGGDLNYLYTEHRFISAEIPLDIFGNKINIKIGYDTLTTELEYFDGLQAKNHSYYN